LVEIACLREIGILVPAGIVRVDFASVEVAAGAAAEEAAGEETGAEVAEVEFCAGAAGV
jgi:hypothetical protein